jgi:hypothetical protein
MLMNRLLKYLTHSLFLAALAMAALMLADHYRVQKYHSVLLEQDVLLYGQRILYNDFDGDGYSEKVRLGYNNLSGVPFAMVTDRQGRVLCNWTFMEEWIGRSDMLFGDCDNNGYEEMYVFTHVGDTIFINGYELHTRQTIVNKKQVEIAGRYNGMNDFDIFSAGITDIDADGYKEVIFFINSGYSIHPRNLYIYSPVRGTISRSPFSGAQVPASPLLIDLTGDGRKEILLNTYAPGNISDRSIPYRDSSSWLMVLDHRNRFLFDPVGFQGYASAVRTAPLINGEQAAIVVLAYYDSDSVNRRAILNVYDLSGNKLKEQPFETDGKPGRMRGMFFHQQGKKTSPFLLDAEAVLWTVDDGFHLKKLQRLNNDIRGLIYSHMVPAGHFLFQSLNQQAFYLYKSDFRHPLYFSVPNEGGHFSFCRVFREEKPPAWSFQVGNYWYLYEVVLNPYFIWRFGVYILLFILVFLLLQLIKKVQGDQLKRKYQNEREVLALQISALKNQVDPHFTLNMLNCIGAMYREKPVQADYFLVKYAGLIRQTLTGSGKTAVTLAEELEFVETFLLLERFRFGNSFEYSIACDEDMAEHNVPRMLVHTFAENALKHGIRPMSGEGRITIDVRQCKGGIEIIISDNGIGMGEAAQNSHDSTGRGLSIAKRLLDIYNKLHDTHITFTIGDRHDENGVHAGTVVRINIPE